MQLKRYEKQGCSAVWSNSKAYSDLIAATSFNDQNQNLFDLELLSIDYGCRSKDLNVFGRSCYNTPFRCLAWGTFGEKNQSLPYGLIFGGMQNGSFTLWNPAQMVENIDPVSQDQIQEQKSLLYAYEPQEQSYPIMCAQWNNLKNNFLAFGSTNLLLVDVGKDVTNPDILQPSQNNPHQGSSISSVSWNKQVAHILASAGSDGLIALWDIKTNKSIFQFKDSNPFTGYRQVQISWSKHISTQIAVTLDDDRKNQLQIWDLRNQKGPIVVIDKVHTKGINSIDWSDIDHDLILASSRDRKISCWNYKQDQAPLSTTEIGEDIEKISWSKSLSSIYSVTTKFGLEIYSLDDKNLLSYVPKWLKVPVGSTFNGNDSLLVYSEQKNNSIQEYKIKIKPNKQIVQNIALLEQYFDKECETLKDLEGEEGQFWKLISTKKNQQGDSDIYNFLGFNKDKIISEAEKYTGIKRSNVVQNTSKKKNKGSKADYIPVSGQDAASFFGSLGTVTNKRKQSDNQLELQNIKYDNVQLNNNWDIGRQRLIKQNMLIGNYDGAIDAALKCGRTAQALIIAYSIDQNTFNNTLKTFFTETTDHFISDILKHIAFKDTEELVQKYDLKKWKQCVALIFSISSSNKRKNLLKILANRIIDQQKANEELRQAAIILFVLADQFENIVDQYSERLKENSSTLNQRKANVIYYCARLIGIYESLNVDTKQSHKFQRILREAALICLESGKKLLAYNIFTKYLASTSYKFIDYLIHNTEELTQYRTSQINIVSLPVMSKKDQTSKNKKNQKKQIIQDKPTNIRPPAKQSVRAPIPDQYAQQDETPQRSQAQTYMEANRKRNNPPPAPIKRQPQTKVLSFPQQQQQQANNEEDSIDTPSYNKPPTVRNQKKPPPPPGPAKISKIATNKADESFEQQDKPVKYPPPQKHTKQKIQRQQQLIHKSSPPPPPSAVKTNRPPPPKPSNLNQSRNQESMNQSYSQRNTNNVPRPPPTKKSNLPPPPKKTVINSPKNQQNPAINQNRPKSRMPPPKATQRVQKQDDLDQDYSQQQEIVSQNIVTPPQTRTPPPKPQQKGRTGPPPPNRAVKVQSHVSEEQDSSKQQTRKTPPPPRRGPPAPPRR